MGFFLYQMLLIKNINYLNCLISELYPHGSEAKDEYITGDDATQKVVVKHGIPFYDKKQRKIYVSVLLTSMLCVSIISVCLSVCLSMSIYLYVFV